ncbi:MAG: hypothetical protein JW795_11790 [Chitinivibrionales bacterium]|nr:hypothetical protein [Chitinivibrionales bacterium]
MHKIKTQAERNHIFSKKLADAVFALLDVETTGLSPEYGDKIVEIAQCIPNIKMPGICYASPSGNFPLHCINNY